MGGLNHFSQNLQYLRYRNIERSFCQRVSAAADVYLQEVQADVSFPERDHRKQVYALREYHADLSGGSP